MREKNIGINIFLVFSSSRKKIIIIIIIIMKKNEIFENKIFEDKIDLTCELIVSHCI